MLVRHDPRGAYAVSPRPEAQIFACARGAPALLATHLTGTRCVASCHLNYRKLRFREGVLRKAPTALPEARTAAGRNSCMVCGFAISKGRSECQVAGASAHERCAMVWIEESKRASRR